MISLLKFLLQTKSDAHGVAQKLVATVADLKRIAADDHANEVALRSCCHDIFGTDTLDQKHSRLSMTAKGTGTSGSGFFVSKLGHIITYEHVVRECSNITVGDNANKQVPVEIIETDRRNDLALLKLSSTSMASAEIKPFIRKLDIRIAAKSGDSSIPLSSNGLLRSDDAELGENVMVGGYPYGDLFRNTIKVTKGIVNAIKGMGDDSSQFQMDAAVQAGNSGGPNL